MEQNESDRPCGQELKNERKVREAIHIHRSQPEISRDSGIEHSSVWTTILSYHIDEFRRFIVVIDKRSDTV